MEDRSQPALPRERMGYQASPDLTVRRAAVAAAVKAGMWRTERAPLQRILGGVRVLCFQSTRAARGRVLHLHGGAFRMGCPEMMGPFAVALSAACDLEVVIPAYRLAPEHPFPAALADACVVMSALRQESNSPLIVSGDSAGGGLAAGLAALSGAGEIKGLVLLSPWLDLTASSSCYQANAATDQLFSLASAQEAAALYLQGVSPRDPLASPLFASPALFPPTFINVGAGEVLAGDSRAFDKALGAAGIASTLHEVVGMEHVAVTRGLALPGAAETFARVVEFIDRLV